MLYIGIMEASIGYFEEEIIFVVRTNAYKIKK
jgi:hypothetical protein